MITRQQFMVLFHEEPTPPPTSPKALQAMVAEWQDWMGGIASQGKFVSSEALGFQGQTVHSDGVITDGPYAEFKEIIGGYLICNTDSFADAARMTEGCPMLRNGEKVEVRDVMVFDLPEAK